METTYNLAKFDQGLTYFVRSVEDNKEAVVGLLNVRELKEHAQYQLTFLNVADCSKREHVLHGVYLTPKNLLDVSIALFQNNYSLISDLQKTTED